ncbi:MAG: CPBP family intramembrane metalloprotease [Agriterribacter sp.]
MTNSIKLTLKYFLLVVLVSLPFFVLGAFIGSIKGLLVKLPISALMFICPAFALLLFDKASFKENFVNIFDFKKINNVVWVLAAILLLPVLMFSTFLVMKFAGVFLPGFELNLSDTVILFTLFFIASALEELGWTGYLTRQLLTNTTILKTGIFIGLLWATWHIIPYFQNEKSFSWIFWQCVSTILLRILMVWLFVSSGTSLFLVILFHTMINMVEFLFPDMGSHYDPFYFSIVLLPFTVTILFLTNKKHKALSCRI